MATTTNNGWSTPDDTSLVKDGALSIRTLGNAIDTSVGTGLLAWQTYAPVLGGGWANGNGVWAARYVKLGKTVHVAGFFTIGTTTTKGTTLTISLPLTAQNSARQTNGYVYATIGATTYPLGLQNSATGNIQATTWAANGTYVTNNAVTATTPATWATNDIIYFGLTYEVA
jgi:hypothetical protein